MLFSEKVLFETMAMLLSIAGVWLMARRHIIGWLVNIAACVMYGFIFWRERLYADAALQILFVFFSLYGWYQWKFGIPSQREEVQVGSVILNGIVLFAVSIAGIGVGWLLSRFTNASIPFADALLTTFSLAATWLQAKKHLESWLWWIIIDIVYVVVFISRNLLVTALLYGIFCLLAFLGYRAWKQSFVPTT